MYVLAALSVSVGAASLMGVDLFRISSPHHNQLNSKQLAPVRAVALVAAAIPAVKGRSEHLGFSGGAQIDRASAVPVNLSDS